MGITVLPAQPPETWTGTLQRPCTWDPDPAPNFTMEGRGGHVLACLGDLYGLGLRMPAVARISQQLDSRYGVSIPLMRGSEDGK